MVKENVPSTEIIEHRMIRWGLENLRKDFNRYLLKEQFKKTEIMNRIKDLNVSLKNLSSNNEFEVKRISNSIEKDLSYLRRLLPQVEEIEFLLGKNKEAVESCLQLSILSVNPEELVITHLFTFSPLYSEVFQCLNELLDEKSKKSIVTTYQGLQKTPFLYEIWGLLSIIHVLINNCGFKPIKNPFLKIRYYVENGFDLEGINFSFERPVFRSPSNKNQGEMVDGRYIYQQYKSILKLQLFYEKVIDGAEKPYKPDYTFIFNDGEKEKIAYLDAKYKPFEEKNDWLKIISNVSFKKYYKSLETKPVVSFLMHPKQVDEGDIPYWNAPTNNKEHYRHKFGSFQFNPNKKRIFQVVKYDSTLSFKL